MAFSVNNREQVISDSRQEVNVSYVFNNALFSVTWSTNITLFFYSATHNKFRKYN